MRLKNPPSLPTCSKVVNLVPNGYVNWSEVTRDNKGRPPLSKVDSKPLKRGGA